MVEEEGYHQILDQQIYWADLLAQMLLAIPDEYSTGTVSMTDGSRLVVGVSTAWPVS